MPDATFGVKAEAENSFGYATAERMGNPLAGAERLRNPLAGAERLLKPLVGAGHQPRMPDALDRVKAEAESSFGYATAERMRNPLVGGLTKKKEDVRL
jgi:uncharacterized protein YaiE (UPF0345 family)